MYECTAVASPYYVNLPVTSNSGTTKLHQPTMCKKFINKTFLFFICPSTKITDIDTCPVLAKAKQHNCSWLRG